MKYEYTGKSQKITLPHGYYYIELYGGKGGGSTGAGGSLQKGYLEIGRTMDLYLYIGGQSTSATGGWNGGETVTESGVYGGGGATCISSKGIDNSNIWNDVHLDNIIMQAEGGQGQGKTGGATIGTYTTTRIDARTEFVNRAGVQAGYIIPKVSGNLMFRSDGYNYDPVGFVDDENGNNLAYNDDSGRYGSDSSQPNNGSSHYWDFLINYNVVAGRKYILRVGSFATSLSSTGWAKWYATFPESEVILYTIITSGGKGGGENYASFKVQNPIAISNQNPGNGYIIIEKATNRLNSNFYKDSYPQETFDFNKLIGGD